MNKVIISLFLCLFFIFTGCSTINSPIPLPDEDDSKYGQIVYSNSFETEKEQSEIPVYAPSFFEQNEKGGVSVHCINETDSWYFFCLSDYDSLMFSPLERYTVTYTMKILQPVTGNDFFYCFFESDVDPSQGAANTSRGCGFDDKGNIVRATEYCTAKAEKDGSQWKITMYLSLSVGDYRITFGSFGKCEYLLDNVEVRKGFV